MLKKIVSCIITCIVMYIPIAVVASIIRQCFVFDFSFFTPAGVVVLSISILAIIRFIKKLKNKK